jgi:membrane-associated protease RseP (regulator of RpoE activity)
MPKILTLISMLLITGCASTKPYRPPQTVEELRSLYAQFNRVEAITHNIFVANSSMCSKRKTNYGFISMFVNKEQDEGQRKLWSEAFNLQTQPTVTYVVPKSAADKAGLLAGDIIISVNNSLWSDVNSQSNFIKQLSEAQKSSNLSLGVLRNNETIILTLIANMACDYRLILNDRVKHRAWSINDQIYIDSGSAKLLKRDDELAFFISHELAHLLLGHTLPERKSELGDYKMRSIIEKDADALGIRLMTHAGYSAKGAETAIKITDLIDSGPITRFFNYHGPYMPADERIKYLRNVLGE